MSAFIPTIPYVAMFALLLLAGAWFWVQARIYEQLRLNHPLIFSQLSEPPAPIGSSDPETRAANESFRNLVYITSGRAAALGDPSLMRYIRQRRVVGLLFVVCFALAVVVTLVARRAG